jgi:DNA-directed RNA polymerase specialized sigma24 family protein
VPSTSARISAPTRTSRSWSGPGDPRLSSLSDAEKRLLARAYFGGLTAREIAESDGIPLGTVKTRLRTALIKVRRANQDKERP